jgi:hypothetical protein
MDPSVSICAAFDVYRKTRERTSDPAFKSVQGSLEKSLECGCAYCSLTCKLVGRGDEVQRHTQRNREAFLQNSGLTLDGGNDAKVTEDVILEGEFNGSGLSFQGTSDLTEELFVTDRKVYKFEDAHVN